MRRIRFEGGGKFTSIISCRRWKHCKTRHYICHIFVGCCCCCYCWFVIVRFVLWTFISLWKSICFISRFLFVILKSKLLISFHRYLFDCLFVYDCHFRWYSFLEQIIVEMVWYWTQIFVVNPIESELETGRNYRFPIFIVVENLFYRKSVCFTLINVSASIIFSSSNCTVNWAIVE